MSCVYRDPENSQLNIKPEKSHCTTNVTKSQFQLMKTEILNLSWKRINVYLLLNLFDWFLDDVNKDFQRVNSFQVKTEFVYLSWKQILMETYFALLF